MTDGTTDCVLTASQAGNGDYNAATNVVHTVQASKKQLTLTGAVAQSKVYDGNAATTVDFSLATLDGEAFTDVVEEDSSGYAAQFDNKNVGDDKPATVSGLVPATQADDYTIAPPTGLTADVTKRDTTASFTAADKVYDHTAAATAARTVTAAVAGDDVSLAGAASFADAAVGSGKTVTIASPSLAGADAGNYNLTAVGTDTADITKRSVTGSFTAANKTFDGTTAATITSRSLAGAVAGDAVALIGGTATFADPNVGVNKTVTGTGFSLGGADAANYNLTGVGTTTATINRQSAGSTTTPEDEAEKALGTAVKDLGLDLNGLGFAFAPANQTNTLKVGAGTLKLFAIGGCTVPCTVKAGKTLVLIGSSGGASAAAQTQKIKLKTQNLSLAAGEFGSSR